ncbi:hypothetical protein QUV83_10765 [Cellulomonas cellasea]|uniref:hypothetical protein n=1 Tax=Cellulomonas cellasea TaxID=43670 RepID=UPI0025A3FE36|nr:hypothetical protein [Cellulomonas cellasea]MDM8085246.1 hypothetical protein [Cellulomonas cellasea]
MPWSLLVVLLVPAAFFCVLWAVFPSPDEPPRWRRRLGAALRRIGERLHPRRRRARRRARRLAAEVRLDDVGDGKVAVPDPFLALRVQTRLGKVAELARTIEDEPRSMARAERLIATQLAYDDLLAEACELAGVQLRNRAKGDPQERFRKEVELAERGWTW